jgi:quinol monooxygenase YgiN
MIIVSGRIYVVAAQRETFLARSFEAVVAARRAPGCLDFVVAADPLELDRVNVYEAWGSESALQTFRGVGPTSDIAALIVRADVARHLVASSGRA